MNERNVEALTGILAEALETTSWGEKPEFIKALARELATYGVLAPSALTTEQAITFDCCGAGCGEDEKLAASVRTELERIAKGVT
jgi:hypothetical protein